jgi:hypothetical protein
MLLTALLIFTTPPLWVAWETANRSDVQKIAPTFLKAKTLKIL